MPRYIIRELLIALIITIALSTAAYESYDHIKKREQASLPVSPELTLGSREVNIVGPSSCYGKIRSNLESVSAEYQFSADGFLRAELQGRKSKADFSMSATFNGLKQLVASDTTLKSDNVDIRIISAGIRPTRLSAAVRLAGIPFKYETTLATELKLIEVRENTFRLDGDMLRTIGGYLGGKEKPRLASTLQVDMVESSEPCNSGDHLRLDALLAALEAFASINPLHSFEGFFGRKQ